MINHDLSNCRRLQQDANVISGGERTVHSKTQHYYLKVVDAQDKGQGFLA